ncbi:MAG: DNA primase [Citrobacter freundii]|nr:DNA primase [Citrobacter freundii]
MIDVTHIIPLDIHTDNVADVACQGAHFDPVSFNIVAPYYLVITSKMHCWSCHQLTHIHGVMFTRFIRKDQDGKGWQSIRRNTFLFHINSLPEEIQKNIKASNYYLDKSKTTGLRYWMNHCEICGERLGDYELFCVENDAFRLMPAEHKITDIVRYLCDARFVMNGPA